MDERIVPVFRTPEDVAPELGMTATELRRYCRQSGIHTRLGRNRIMLHRDDIPRLVEWVRERRNTTGTWAGDEDPDPFA